MAFTFTVVGSDVLVIFSLIGVRHSGSPELPMAFRTQIFSSEVLAVRSMVLSSSAILSVMVSSCEALPTGVLTLVNSLCATVPRVNRV